MDNPPKVSNSSSTEGKLKGLIEEPKEVPVKGSSNQRLRKVKKISKKDVSTNTEDITCNEEAVNEEEVSSRDEIKPSSALPDQSLIIINRPENMHCVALPLLKQRLGYLWEKKMFTDVVFIVGPNKTKIEAHRIILASASEVFQGLLFLEEKPAMKDGKFVLYDNDFSDQAFEVFIKAMYTNEIPICLTLAMALEVFYATKKYVVVFLEDQILEHIRQLLTVSNVFEALSLSTNAIELTYLAPICWKIIEEQTSSVLEYHMDDLDVHLFAKVLERDRLNLEEVELFQIAVRWAANLCKVHELKKTGKNKRQFMEPLIKHFRFTTMTPTQFSEVVVPSRILEPKEIQQIQYVFNKGKNHHKIVSQLPYKTSPRLIPSRVQTSEEVPSSHKAFDRWTISSRGTDDIPVICSDSAVVAPNVSNKLHMKRVANSTKLKPKRVPTARTKS